MYLSANDYRQPLNLYILAPLQPGNRKSSTLEACKRPILEYEAEQIEIIRPAWRAAKAEVEALKKRVEVIRAKAARADSEAYPDRLSEVLQVERDLEDAESRVPWLPRFFAADCTTEKLGGLLFENKGCLSIMEAEGVFFDVLAGKYSKMPSFDVVLQSYDREQIRVDRQSSGSIIF